MYSLQALWTQARQKLHVITIIANNEGYSILQLENSIQRLKRGAVLDELTQMSGPPVDWVSLAQGMGVHAVRVNTNEELVQALTDALEARGPTLIDVCLARRPDSHPSEPTISRMRDGHEAPRR
jgi:acetolactate synthase-1/2/3 large subunit